MTKMEEARTLLFTEMYTAVSKATAEVKDFKGNVEKTIFKGFVKDLFKGVCTLTVTKFLWAISHKTESLPTVLFRVTYCGKKGYEIERLHSGFVSNATGKKVFGTDLVPYIIEATKLYKTNPRKPKAVEAPVALEQPCAIFYADKPVHPEQLSNEELELGIKEYTLSLQLLQQEKAKREALKVKKAELLELFNDMAKEEGFDLKDILSAL